MAHNRANTRYDLHGWMIGLEGMDDRSAMRMFCIRRGNAVAESFESSLTVRDFIARIYYQGLLDGISLFESEN
jgi:hypothetical protein